MQPTLLLLLSVLQLSMGNNAAGGEWPLATTLNTPNAFNGGKPVVEQVPEQMGIDASAALTGELPGAC